MAVTPNPQKVLLTAAEKASKTLNTAATSLSKGLEQFQDIPAMIEDMGQTILSKEAELADITAKVADQRRISKAQLEIQIMEDEDKVFNNLRTARGFAAITVETLTDLETALDTANNDMDDKVSAAVHAATGSVATKHKHEMDMLNATHAQDTASLQAANDQLRSQITFLNEQIERNTRDKAAERETQVSIAQANANAQGVVVNTSSK